jgi:hypothetical protein
VYGVCSHCQENKLPVDVRPLWPIPRWLIRRFLERLPCSEHGGTVESARMSLPLSIILTPSELAVGTSFVFLHSLIRFNQRIAKPPKRVAKPPKAWASTTRVRYVLGATFYAALVTAVYWLIVGVPQLLPANLVTGWPAAFERPPLLAALLLTVLLPKVMELVRCDYGLRWVCQRFARIPKTQQLLSGELQSGRSYSVPEERRNEVTEFLLENGCRPSAVRFDNGNEPKQVFTRVTSLFLKVRGWSKDAPFINFIEDNEVDHELLCARYNVVRTNMLTLFRMNKTANGYKKFGDDVCNEMRDYLVDLCDFISRGVLQSGWLPAAREAQLSHLGFKVAPAKPQPSKITHEFWNDLILLLGSMALLMFFSFVLAGFLRGLMPGAEQLKKVLILSVLVSTTQFVAVVAATIPRCWIDFKKGKIPRFAVYLIVALVAYVGGVGLCAAAQLLLRPSSFNFSMSLAWALLLPATTIATAYNIDAGARRIAWREGLVTAGAVWVAMTVICIVLGADDWLHAVGRFAVAGIMGFFIGWWIPRRYREESGMERAAFAVATNSSSGVAVTVGDGKQVTGRPSLDEKPLFLEWDRTDEEFDEPELETVNTM